MQIGEIPLNGPKSKNGWFSRKIRISSIYKISSIWIKLKIGSSLSPRYRELRNNKDLHPYTGSIYWLKRSVPSSAFTCRTWRYDKKVSESVVKKEILNIFSSGKKIIHVGWSFIKILYVITIFAWLQEMVTTKVHSNKLTNCYWNGSHNQFLWSTSLYSQVEVGSWKSFFEVRLQCFTTFKFFYTCW